MGGGSVVGGALVVVVVDDVLVDERVASRCPLLLPPPRVASTAPAAAEMPTMAASTGIHSQRRPFIAPCPSATWRSEAYAPPTSAACIRGLCPIGLTIRN